MGSVDSGPKYHFLVGSPRGMLVRWQNSDILKLERKVVVVAQRSSTGAVERSVWRLTIGSQQGRGLYCHFKKLRHQLIQRADHTRCLTQRG